MTNGDDQLRRKEAKVTVLMTAESIIIVFLIAYAPAVSQMLVYWSDKSHPGPLFTTVFSGLLIYTLILIAFKGILMLYRSIDANDPNNENYEVGYDLFLVVVGGSCVFVAMNAISILQYGKTGSSLNVPYEPWIWIWAVFFAFWVLFIWRYPLKATRLIRKLVGRQRKSK